MTTALIISIFIGAYYAIGSYIAFQIINPKTVGDFLIVYLFGWPFLPIIMAAAYLAKYLNKLLSIRVRK